MKYAMFFLVLFLMGVGMVSAQEPPNDPRVNPDANACFPGGTWAGTCNNFDADRNGRIDERDAEYMYRCGWYTIRVQFGLVNNVPSDCPRICRPTLINVNSAATNALLENTQAFVAGQTRFFLASTASSSVVVTDLIDRTTGCPVQQFRVPR